MPALAMILGYEREQWYEHMLQPEILWAVIALVGIIAWTITTIARQHYRHQERLAMIERGMRPDSDEHPHSHAS